MSTKKIINYIELTKPRISLFALVFVAMGYSIAVSGQFLWLQLVISLIGIGLVGGSCCVLNQYKERDLDLIMNRTMGRPLPSGRLSPINALIFGLVIGTAGELILFLFVNWVTALLAASMLFLYVGVYTPTKRISSICTLIGAIPGAMPPLLGWTAATGKIELGGIVLFSILFIWQIPHFLAIAWIYKEDYSRASFQMLSVIDQNGQATARQVIVYSLVLLPMSLLPSVLGTAGITYFWGALIMGIIFLGLGIELARHRTKIQARRLFLASLIYLPALCFLLAWDSV